MSSISAVIAAYGRPERLGACLDALRAQPRTADEVVVVVVVVVVVHCADEGSARCVAQRVSGWQELRSVQTDRRSIVAAYNRGLSAARGTLVAYVDDDAVPAADWLDRIVRTFEQDQRIAAVGGRDVLVTDDGVDGVPRRFGWLTGPPAVGRIQWFGRMIGNHHVGEGAPRDVDVLKGVNMSFRRTAVIGDGFDERLRGRGVQMHSELSICLPLRRRGLRVVYDPSIVVLHYAAPRTYGEQRGEVSRDAVFATAHNEALEILDYFGPVRRLVFAVWALAIGTSASPGLAVLGRDLIEQRPAAWAGLSAAQRGRAAAWRTRRQRRIGSGASTQPTGSRPTARCSE